MPNVKTVILTGAETEVRFGENYPYFWVRNCGSEDVHMSLSPNVVPDADGVICVPAGSGRSTGDVGQANVLYFVGSGKIEITPQFNAVCPFFKPAGKGGDEPSPAAFLPHSEGLTYYFDFENGDDPVQKIWRDQIRGLELPLADTQPGDALTTANSEFSVPESSGQWAYTYYVISRNRAPKINWKTIIGSYGTVPQFNLCDNYGQYYIGTGSSGGQMHVTTTISPSDFFTVHCLNFSNGFGEWYCHRHSMTQPVANGTGYHAPNDAPIVIGSKIDFKAIAIFKNISQGRGLILENIAFLKDKFQVN